MVYKHLKLIQNGHLKVFAYADRYCIISQALSSAVSPASK